MRFETRPVWVRRKALMASLLLAMTTAAAPTMALTPEPGRSMATDASASTGGLLIDEVLFDPRVGETAFVEIANTGLAPVSLAELTLAVDGTLVPLEAAGTLAPEQRQLVMFDVAKDPEGAGQQLLDTLRVPPDPAGSIRAPLPAVVRPDAGVVELRDGVGHLLDRAAWGSSEPNAVSMSVGDFAPGQIEPGTGIGRPPGADTPNRPTDWVAYAPSQVSPGTPNPLPAVAVLLPMDGAVLDGPRATLAWYPVTGATSYHVRVAAEGTPDTPQLDATAIDPTVDTGLLAPGRYIWSVRAIAADGSTSPDSAVSGFELGHGTTARSARSSVEGDVSVGQAAAGDVGKQLNVPWLAQGKDTAMLLLEEPHEHGPHAWDTAHASKSALDPADQQNCALAMVAMVDHFYGGDLSQDRIGYELLQDRQPGPEQDLMYGTGLDIAQTDAAFAFALGAPVTYVPEYDTYDAVWAAVTSTIDAGRPVPGANPHHGFVITGYAVRNGHRLLSVNDPAIGRTVVDIEAARVPATGISLWMLPADPVGRVQEASVSTDSDGDGVVDFDETERFHTDPSVPDSDADGVRDKQDIASSIFDPAYGYAANPAPDSPGRDFDVDGIPTELDADSDAGGCKDGEEDTDGDGHRNGRESWNFDSSDDACRDLYGTISFDRTSTYDSANGVGGERWTQVETLHATIHVAMRFDPRDPTRLVDAGSTFSVERAETDERANSSACTPTRHISTSRGTYGFGDPAVPTVGHTRDELGVDVHSGIEGTMDPERGLLILTVGAVYPETTEDTCALIAISTPDIVDSWSCGDAFAGFGGVGINATIETQATGPEQVTVDCTEQGPVFHWDDQKVVATGQLTLVER